MDNAYITILSTASVDGEVSNSEITSRGQFKKISDDEFTFSYKESAATGFEGCSTKIEFKSNERLNIFRTGDVTTNLLLARGKKQFTHYNTPYGSLSIGIKTHDIINELTENGGNFYAKYTIDNNTVYLSDNEITIIIKLL